MNHDYFTPLRQESAGLAARLPVVLAYLELTRFAAATHAPGPGTAKPGPATPMAGPPHRGADKETHMAEQTPVDNWLDHAARCERRGELARAYRALAIALRFERDGDCIMEFAGMPCRTGDVAADQRRPDRSVYA